MYAHLYRQSADVGARVTTAEPVPPPSSFWSQWGLRARGPGVHETQRRERTCRHRGKGKKNGSGSSAFSFRVPLRREEREKGPGDGELSYVSVGSFPVRPK